MGVRCLRTAAVLCAAGLVLSVWPSAVGAQERKTRHPDAVRVAGRITAVSGNTFDLETPRRGPVQVQHDSATKWKNLTPAALKVGASVGVIGTLKDKVLQARVVGAIPAHPRKDRRKRRWQTRPVLKGEVTGVEDSTFTLKTRRGEVEVTYTKATKFRGGSAEDIKPGTKVGVVPVNQSDKNRGSLRQTAKVTAKVIGFPKAPRDRGSKRTPRLRAESGA